MNKKYNLALVFASICFLITSCLVHPKVSTDQNEECKLITKKLTLDIWQVDEDRYEHCKNMDCVIANLLLDAPLGTASTIVSGSIALVGNTFYYVEEYGSCDESEIGNALSLFKKEIKKSGDKIVSDFNEMINYYNNNVDSTRNKN